MRILIMLAAALAIGACRQGPQLPALISPYKIDIQQGNVVTQDMVDKLKPGLTRSQVRFVLGSPLVVDMFHTDRWDYIYLLQKQGKPDERRRLTVIFEDEKLVRVEGDVVLSDKSQEPIAPASKPAAGKPAASAAPKPAVVEPAEKPPVRQEASPAKDKSPAAKSDTNAGEVKADAEKVDAKSDPPPQRGLFGRMLEKIGL